MSSVAVLAFVVILVLVSAIDVRERRIPNRATGAAAMIAVLVMAIQDPARIPAAVAVAAIVAIPLLIASLVKPAGMGMGDVKLMAVIGLYLGWAAVPVLLGALLAAAVTGVVVGLALRQPLGEMTLPLAPFLAVATIFPLAKLIEFPLH